MKKPPWRICIDSKKNRGKRANPLILLSIIPHLSSSCLPFSRSRLHVKRASRRARRNPARISFATESIFQGAAGKKESCPIAGEGTGRSATDGPSSTMNYRNSMTILRSTVFSLMWSSLSRFIVTTNVRARSGQVDRVFLFRRGAIPMRSPQR